MGEHGEPKVGEDVAEADFERFRDAMDLDFDPNGMSDEEESDFVDAKRRMIRAMMRGTLVVNDEGEPVFTPTKGDRSPITFHEPQGGHYMSMAPKEGKESQKRGFQLISQMTGEPVKRFGTMYERDLKVVSAITALFLGG